jgi:hypothetical protein
MLKDEIMKINQLYIRMKIKIKNKKEGNHKCFLGLN